METSPPVIQTTLVSSSRSEHIGWLIVAIVMFITTLIFLFLWISCLTETPPLPPPGVCFGSFGVHAGVDANALNSCGPSRSDPCIFAINTLVAAQDQCNLLQIVCNAFTFNESTSTMKIVQPNNTFTSSSANLFTRQSNT